MNLPVSSVMIKKWIFVIVICVLLPIFIFQTLLNDPYEYYEEDTTNPSQLPSMQFGEKLTQDKDEKKVNS